MKGIILNTFLFLLLTFILLFAAFIIISPFLSVSFRIHQNIQENIEAGMFGNVTNSTKDMLETENNILNLLPYLLVISFILIVIIYGAITEIRKGAA